MLGLKLGKIMPVRGRHGLRISVVMSSAEVTALLPLVTGGDGIFHGMHPACELLI